jgi:hypothetical protein
MTRAKRRHRLSTALRRAQGVPTRAGRRLAGRQPPEGPSPSTTWRVRELGLTPEQAATAEGGTGHGLLRLAGILSADGCRIAERYALLRRAWQATFAGRPKEAAAVRLPCVTPAGSIPEPARASAETPEDRERRIHTRWNAVAAEFKFRPYLAAALNDAAIRGLDLRHSPRAELAVRAIETIAPLFGADPADVREKTALHGPQCRLSHGHPFKYRRVPKLSP